MKRKKHGMKKILTLIFILAFSASCGAQTPVIPEIDAPPAAVSSDSAGAGPDAEMQDVQDDISVGSDEEAMEITWGYSHIPDQDFTNVLLPDDSEVIKALNKQFNVMLKGVEILFGNNMYFGDWEAVDNLPDVLTVNGDAEYAYGTGNFRTIPHEMVERYAPNLAALLNANPDGWAANNSGSAPNEFLGFGYYYETPAQLQLYSAYRMDWLEQSGFELPADIVEISPGQYFTPTPFTIDKFYDAMRALTGASASTPEHYAFTFTQSNDVHYVLTTDLSNPANMFGLNMSNMNDGGKVNMYYATPAYKDFLVFMADMYAQGFAAVKGTSSIEYSPDGTSSSGGGGDDGKNQQYEVGYWNEFTSMLVNDDAWYSDGRQLLDQNTSAKILYAPPETHVPFESDYQPAGTDGWFAADKRNLIMVNKSVSDEKLAVILKIYDTCAFDPETKVLASYGIEGVNFNWAGEAYNSFVKQLEDSPTYNRSTNLLNPPVQGGPAYSPFYDQNINPDNPVYLHSITPEAVSMTVPAYKEDPNGEHSAEMTAWNETYYAGMRTITTDYFYEIVLGEADVSATWDGYIAELNAAGLPELLAILEKYDTVE